MSQKNNISARDKFVSIDDLYQLKQVTDVSIRPHTNDVYYTINQANKEDNGYRQSIWRCIEEPEPFTQGLPRDSNMQWSPDGEKLAFISARGVQSGNNSGDAKPIKPQIFLISPNGGEAVQLTNIPTGVSNFRWSRDGKKIVFISRMNKEELETPSDEEKKDLLPDELTLMAINQKKLEDKKIEPRIITRSEYRAGTSYKDDRKGQIHILDIATKKIERWTNSLEDDFTFAFLTNDNSFALTSRQKTGEGDQSRNWEIVKISPKGEVEILVDDHYGWGVYFEPSPNGEFLVTNIDNKELGTLGQSSLCLYKLKDCSRKILAKEIDNEKYSPKWSEDNNFVYFFVFEKGLADIWRIEIKTEKIEKIVEGDREIVGFDISKDGEILAFHSLYVNDPSRVYRFHIPSKKEELIHAPNEEILKKKILGKTEEVWYDGNNQDFRIQGWILTPPNFDPKKKYPLALNMHGGPHVMWSNHQSIPMFHEFQLLAAEGYVVFYCNPRGSNGYGQEFYKAAEKAWGDDDSQDILNGVDLVIKRGYIDEKRMGITGGSYAGFMTAWIIGHDDRFAAAVSQRGVYFFSSFWATTDNARILINDEFGTSPLGDNKFLWERSPAAYAKNIKTPLRIIHSEQDFRAPIPDAEMLYTAIKMENPNLEVEFLRYPGEGHELSRSGQPTRRLDRLEKIVEWFDKYCQVEKYNESKDKENKKNKIKEEYIKKMRKEIKELK